MWAVSWCQLASCMDLVEDAYVIVQSQAVTMVTEDGIAYRLKACITALPEYLALCEDMCPDTAPLAVVNIFIRMQLYGLCQGLTSEEQGAPRVNRKMLKLSSSRYV